MCRCSPTLKPMSHCALRCVDQRRRPTRCGTAADGRDAALAEGRGHTSGELLARVQALYSPAAAQVSLLCHECPYAGCLKRLVGMPNRTVHSALVPCHAMCAVLRCAAAMFLCAALCFSYAQLRKGVTPSAWRQQLRAALGTSGACSRAASGMLCCAVLSTSLSRRRRARSSCGQRCRHQAPCSWPGGGGRWTQATSARCWSC